MSDDQPEEQQVFRPQGRMQLIEAVRPDRPASDETPERNIEAALAYIRNRYGPGVRYVEYTEAGDDAETSS